MHKTEATKKRASLRLEAKKLEKEVKALAKVGQMGPAARTRQDEADRLKAEADKLKGEARLEDLQPMADEEEEGQGHRQDEHQDHLYLLDGLLARG